MQIRLQVDAGAQVNTICQRYIRREQVHLTIKNLIMWNKINMKPVGKTVLNVINPKFSTVYHILFAIILIS